MGFIFDGALFGFVLARFQLLDFNKLCGSSIASSAAPGECYWFENFPRYRIGIMLHLGTILPAGLLAVFQFIPAIRHRFTLYHRIAGYTILLLVLLSYAGALMIADHTFGGDPSVQGFIGFLTIITATALVLAIINIKKLQIEQHRAWMLRAWVYFGSIISMRIISFLAAALGSRISQQYTPISCAEISYLLKNTTQVYHNFPACDPANAQFAMENYIAIKASMTAGLVGIVGALRSNFGMAGWLSIAIHMLGVEVYLRLTPREAQRLRNVSYQRQLEAGMASPGSAGLVRERFADADVWVVPSLSTRSKDGNLCVGF
ncbi:MAG: hypothetical protein GOMPHAMPRED_001679 [Gomphillus americanus]|uniref:DUF2306 domain-containing protein n=1 Tax=Gomphillus americanus TaxID=1940652 RepID=A0A8H3IHN7_9LECA|nr:MAG: hypothetical protein GOMPHAMPRED_001679 [Gomphillus americanus]